MSRTKAVKKVWNLVEDDKIREAEEIAREYNIEMCFVSKAIRQVLKSLKHKVNLLFFM